MKKYLFILSLILSVPSWAQDTDVLLNHVIYHYIDRVDIRGYADTLIHTDHKPYGRPQLQAVMGRVHTAQLSPLEQAWHKRIQLLVDDSLAVKNEAKGALRYFYTNGRDLVHVATPRLKLFVNPVLHTSLGIDQNNYATAASPNLPLAINSRGIQVRGTLGDKIGFHTEVYDNITRFHQFIYDEYRSTLRLYGESFIKTFGNENALNYFSSRAYMTYRPIKEMRIKFGKDRAFWGNGYQSLALSDYAADYLMLNIRTRVWKLEYVNHFTQMIDFLINRNDVEGTLPRKYGVFHQLSYKPNNQLSFGIFESIVYTPVLANGNRGIELQYFNPIIFYRAIEQYIGSPDNAMIGGTFKWNFLQHFQLYGQLIIDDYNFGVRDQGSNYWANKVGWQLGAKYIDVLGIPTLDLQIEHNRVRPFTYQHFNIASNYTNYGQSLGHSAGANLLDFYTILQYHPLPPLHVYLSYGYRMQGLDQDGFNYGGDYQQPTGNRPRAEDFNYAIGDGLGLNVHNVYGKFTYQLWNLDAYLELEARYHRANAQESLSILGGLRANIEARPIR
ncbi:MAG: capsule assembly Wzi family protein [Bacteroidota bacterium]